MPDLFVQGRDTEVKRREVLKRMHLKLKNDELARRAEIEREQQLKEAARVASEAKVAALREKTAQRVHILKVSDEEFSLVQNSFFGLCCQCDISFHHLKCQYSGTLVPMPASLVLHSYPS